MAALLALLADCADGMSRWGTGGWIWMGLMMLAGVVLVVAIVYLLPRAPSLPGPEPLTPPPGKRRTRWR